MELAHRNSQASVPLRCPHRSMGFCWNNAGIGRAALGTTIMSFEASSTKALEYWVEAYVRVMDDDEVYHRHRGGVENEVDYPTQTMPVFPSGKGWSA